MEQSPLRQGLAELYRMVKRAPDDALVNIEADLQSWARVSVQMGHKEQAAIEVKLSEVLALMSLDAGRPKQ